MGYAEFNPNVKKVNLKPKGEVEIVLTTSLSDLRGSVETISDMIDQKVRLALESTVVTYSVEINTRTEKPIRTYRVDDNGIVSEVKPEGEQLEMELGLPKREDHISEVAEEIDQKIVDDFILELLAPEYPDMPYPFLVWVSMLNEGTTYMRIASDFGLSSGKVSELLDEYRSRVAPLAAKWKEWRQGKTTPTPEAKQEGKPEEEKPEESSSQNETPEGKEGEETTPEGKTVTEHDAAGSSESSASASVDKEKLENYILTHRPKFDGDDYDFPTLLSQRLNDKKTWMEIAKTLGIQSTQLSTKYKQYKERVVKRMNEGGAA